MSAASRAFLLLGATLTGFIWFTPASSARGAEPADGVFVEDFTGDIRAGLPAGWTLHGAPGTEAAVRNRGDQPFLEFSGDGAQARGPAIPVEGERQYECRVSTVFYPNLRSAEASGADFRVQLLALDARKEPVADMAGRELLLARLYEGTESFVTVKAGIRVSEGYFALTSLAGEGHRVWPCPEEVRFVQPVLKLRGQDGSLARVRRIEVAMPAQPRRPLFMQYLTEDHRSETLARLWDNLTCGENVALNRPVRVYPPVPGGMDRTRVLTDGRIAFRGDKGLAPIKRIRKLAAEEKATLGMPMTDMLHVMVDLGKSEAVSRVVLRVQGGTVNASPMHMFPKRVELALSEDGERWYRAGRWENRQFTDRDRPGEYRFPKVGDVLYVAPVAFCDLDLRARYVGLHLGRYGRLYFDEIAVVRGEAGRDLSHLPACTFPLDGIAIWPVKDCIMIANDALVPDWSFFYNDDRLVTEHSWLRSEIDFDPIRLHFELPDGLSMMDYKTDPRLRRPWPVSRHHKRPLPVFPSMESVVKLEREGQPYTRYTFDQLSRDAVTAFFRFGPVCFETQWPEGRCGTMHVWASWEGGSQEPVEVPFTVYRLGRIDRAPEKFYAHLGFLAGVYPMAWPDYFDLCRRLGFGAISVAPRFFRIAYRDRDWAAEMRSVVGETRAAGLGVIMQSSPWNGDFARSPFVADRTAYRVQVDRLAEEAAIVDPDYVYYDVEGLHSPQGEEEQAYVRQRMESAGLEDFRAMVRRIGLEMMRDSYEGIQRAMGEQGHAVWPDRARPRYGFYYAGHPRYNQVFDMRDIYGRYLHLAQPEVYAGGDPEVAARVVRNAFRELEGVSFEVVPVLSPGTRGEYPGPWLRDQVLEVFANGGSGVTYFPSSAKFDGRDYFYHAQALAIVARVEHLVGRSRVIPGDLLRASDPSTKICGVQTAGGEAAILVSNYHRARPYEVRLTFKNSAATGAKVVDVESGDSVGSLGDGGTFAVTMTPSPRTRLFHLAPQAD